MHGWSAWMGWGGPTGVVWMLALLALTVLAAVALARTLLPDPRRPRDERGRDEAHDDALRVLRLRFANGEIDETEFLSRRAALERENRPLPTARPSPTPGGPR